MLKLNSLAILGALTLFSTAAVAQEEESGLTTEVELGAVYTSGNAEAESINFRGEVDWDRGDWDYGFLIDGLRQSQNDVLAAQRFYYVANANYELDEVSFIQARLAHEDDRFSGYDSQTDLTVNYGRTTLTNLQNMSFTYEAGLGYRQSRAEAEDFDDAMFRLAGDYQWNISESADIGQTLSAEVGNETSIYRSESSIETRILDNLSLRFSIFVKHQTEVPVGRKKTDTETSITFVMNF
jgi:putative salt-induced outer membrane protein